MVWGPIRIYILILKTQCYQYNIKTRKLNSNQATNSEHWKDSRAAFFTSYAFPVKENMTCISFTEFICNIVMATGRKLILLDYLPQELAKAGLHFSHLSYSTCRRIWLHWDDQRELSKCCTQLLFLHQYPSVTNEKYIAVNKEITIAILKTQQIAYSG